MWIHLPLLFMVFCITVLYSLYFSLLQRLGILMLLYFAILLKITTESTTVIQKDSIMGNN